MPILEEIKKKMVPEKTLKDSMNNATTGVIGANRKS